MQKTEQANSQMVKAGFTAPMDGALSRANLASTQMNLVNQQKQCDLLVKTLVQVTGMQETALRPLLNSGKSKSLPKPALFNVSDVPAQMLQHRPDIAALEREVYATYAEIGSAQADRYPSLSLTGVISTVLTGGTSAASWSFGPALSLPIFDAGQKKAAVESAKATYVSAIADYQSGVRSAVSEVEQALVQLNSIAAQEQASENSVREYENYFNALQLSWKAGNTNLLDLESARRSALSAQMSQIELQTSRVQQWIALYKAMGGGWQKNAVVTQPETSLKDINF
jgi:NodT family efflux transporter outer membrane factor (OMF) lipoprotein